MIVMQNNSISSISFVKLNKSIKDNYQKDLVSPQFIILVVWLPNVEKSTLISYKKDYINCYK